MKSLFLGDIDEAVKYTIKYFDKQTSKKDNDIYKKGSLSYEKLFLAKDYDNVFYFTQRVDDMENLSDFISLLDASSFAQKYVYIIRSESFNVTNNEKLNVIREILNTYADKTGKNVIVLNLSCLYGNDFIDGKIKYIKEEASYDSEMVNYINVKDFAHFLYLFSIHKVSDRYLELKAEKSFKLKQLIDKNMQEGILEEVKLPFEWKSMYCISNEKNINKFFEKNKGKKKGKVIKILEIIVLFFVFEVLINLFRTTLALQFVDFRLIYIIICAIYYDFGYSLLATSLAIVSFLVVNIHGDYNLSVLSNTDNWIAVITYLIITIVVKNKIKKFEIDNKLANEKIDKLEKQNKFKERNLNKYEIKIKELNKALIMHNKSFSKIENIITKYKNVNIENVYELFSEALDTKNIVIFETDGSRFGNAYTTQNIDFNYLAERSPHDFITGNKIWVNNDLNKRLPLYIVPIYKNKNVCYCVSIWDYEISIVNHDYRNNLISLSNIISILKENEK